MEYKTASIVNFNPLCDAGLGVEQYYWLYLQLEVINAEKQRTTVYEKQTSFAGF